MDNIEKSVVALVVGVVFLILAFWGLVGFVIYKVLIHCGVF